MFSISQNGPLSLSVAKYQLFMGDCYLFSVIELLSGLDRNCLMYVSQEFYTNYTQPHISLQ